MLLWYLNIVGCVNTSVLLTEALNLQDKDYQLCFQSIFGREEWIKPQTKLSLESLAQDGVEHIQVICPGFSADCLETLEEINEENRGYFIQAGGKNFSYITFTSLKPVLLLKQNSDYTIDYSHLKTPGKMITLNNCSTQNP
jgi:protoheme ferro-lyase